MIGKKDITLVNTGRKIAKKYKPNFSRFTEHDFYVRIILVDEKSGEFKKAVEYIVNADNWQDYVDAADFGNLKVDKIELSTK